MSPHFNLFPGKMAFESSVPKTKGTIQISLAAEAKANVCHGMGVQHGWLEYVCEGTIDMEATVCCWRVFWVWAPSSYFFIVYFIS